ncbi:DUF916 domain-containing protein [Vagococcus hydrophili]|uniref:DUF916 domain-containing protein n=1 Tax=Vagococcus hydrophili TaxID=2714947 RepID=A0A6G8ATJ5_9ENTE|nr:DUF916 domain-containing protein [Vagococcus hydrophili]QIL48300.1 DUF916 domain-containing protein [Vagococcus hydrophili]
MNRILKLVFLLVNVPILFLYEMKTVHAEEISKVDFTVEPIFPDNQVNKNLAYYDLMIKPNTEQKILLRVKNLTKEPIVVDVGITEATTNRYGKIDYGQEKPMELDPRNLSITDLIMVDEEFKQVKLKGFEEKEVSVTIKSPEKEFSGIKLGAVTFIKSGEDKIGENDYGYRIGVLLNEDRKNYDETGSLKLRSVSAGLDNGFEAINLLFSNQEPQVIKQVDINIEIRKKGKKKVITEYFLESCSIAPESKFQLSIPWDIQKMNLGYYDVKIVAKNSTKEWVWNEALEVKMTKELENQGIVLKNKNLGNHELLYLIIFFIAVLNVVVIIKRLRRSIHQKLPKEEYKSC